MEVPRPTFYERKLASRLAANNIPYKSQPVIWYTRANYYTPDFIIGQKLIVEVDGKIHSMKHRMTPDRIRQRALKNLGYYVMRVSNDTIRINVKTVVKEIIQQFYETVDLQQSNPKVEIVKHDTYDSIPKYVQDKISQWAVEFNRSFKEELWTADYFRLHLPDYDSILVQIQSALERFMLLLLGLNLKTGDDGALDFEYSAQVFGKGIEIIREIFGEQGATASIHLKNMFNVSAPGFFKNLVFYGGPNINPGIVSINNLNLLKRQISEFNRHFSSYQVSVEVDEVRDECLYAFKNIETNANFQWMAEWKA
ncbi:MAG: endonuclease domain-containing protein [Thermoproteota archaeon]|nr:endonuclease domain-containing protein [Thermoproteota archaeon]